MRPWETRMRKEERTATEGPGVIAIGADMETIEGIINGVARRLRGQVDSSTGHLTFFRMGDSVALKPEQVSDRQYRKYDLRLDVFAAPLGRSGRRSGWIEKKTAGIRKVVGEILASLEEEID